MSGRVNVSMIPYMRKRQTGSAIECLLAIAFGGSIRARAVERYVVAWWGHIDDPEGLPTRLQVDFAQSLRINRADQPRRTKRSE
jgi:hypothetical protein